VAKYTAPFHAPRFTDTQFKEMRKKYIEKHGYTVTFPALSDIIHITKFTPMTAGETRLWKARKYNDIPPGRRAEIREEKARKKAKFLAMLGDPSPDIAQSAGAILTAIDDAQDAISTLACVGLILASAVGGTVASAIVGPLGLILGAASLMNMINPYSHVRKLLRTSSTGRGAKKNLEKLTDKNPFSKKAKFKLLGWRPGMDPPPGMTIMKGTKFPKGWKQGDPFPKGVSVKKGTKIPLGKLKKFKPTIGNAIEALQTTDQIWGVGICLGPIVGFAQAAISGGIRTALGDKVDWKVGWPKKSEAEKEASMAMIAASMTNMQTWMSDKDDEMRSIVSASLAMQVLHDPLTEWNPIDHIEDLGSYLVQAPPPTDPLTREIMEEEGIDPDTASVWPGTNKQWLSIDDIQERVQEQAAANLKHYAEQNRHDLAAFNALNAADDMAMNFMSAMEGPDQIIVDYLRTERIVITILDNGWEYPENVTEAQVRKFEDWCEVHEYMDTSPSAKDIWNYANIFCGFKWLRSPNEFR